MSDKQPDPFEFLKQLWSPMGLPMPGMVTPSLDVDEIEKKINDLKSVENWLNLNLNMLRLSIQGLEMQKNTLAALKAMQPGAPGAGASGGANNPFGDPSAWMNMMQQAAASAAGKPPDTKSSGDKPFGDKPAEDKPKKK